MIVLEDVDHLPGSGALVGEIHATIGLALELRWVHHQRSGAGPSGRGSHRLSTLLRKSGRFSRVRACRGVRRAGEIGGLKVCPGDLIHGDRHGVQTIPLSIAPEIPKIAAEIKLHEQELIYLLPLRPVLAGRAGRQDGWKRLSRRNARPIPTAQDRTLKIAARQNALTCCRASRSL